MVHRGQVIGLININHSSLSSGCANLGLSKLLVLVLTALTALGIDGGLSIAVPLPLPLAPALVPNAATCANDNDSFSLPGRRSFSG